MRALAVIDGEHYPDVVRDALAELPYEFVAAHVAGGTEKLRGGEEDYGVPLAEDLEAALAEHDADVVVDLSDEPVLGPRERFRMASRVLSHGVPYVGPDFRLEPPPLLPFELPSLGVVGTGKRIGKTAISGHAARLLAREHSVVVVAMGRGGPREPELADKTPTLGTLLELSRAGRHAASDYLETAVLAGVPTVGCRRCGGGFAGAPATSNVEAGAELAAEQRPDLVIFDGSGSALPPIATDRRVLVTSAQQAVEVAAGYLNAFRVLVSDLVVLTMAEEEAPVDELSQAFREIDEGVPIVPVVLRPRPDGEVAGRSVAYFTTAPEATHDLLSQHLADAHGATAVTISGNLAHRDALRADLERTDADVFLVEVKAAAVDVVAEHAAEHGVEVLFADNEVLTLPGHPDLDEELSRLADEAVATKGAEV